MTSVSVRMRAGVPTRKMMSWTQLAISSVLRLLSGYRKQYLKYTSNATKIWVNPSSFLGKIGNDQRKWQRLTGLVQSMSRFLKHLLQLIFFSLPTSEIVTNIFSLNFHFWLNCSNIFFFALVRMFDQFRTLNLKH
jgi:hypothetical protein